jgi:hypothetical protein
MLIVSPGFRVTGDDKTDSAIIRAPAAEFEPDPLASARPFTVMTLPLMFVSTGVVSVNWQVPEEGAVPSFMIEHMVAGVVCTKSLVVS